MINRFLSTVTVLGLLALPAAPAVAQDEAPPPAVKFTTDFGFVKTGGNTDLQTLSLAERIEYKTNSPLVLKQVLGWVYGKTDGVESANQIVAGLRGNYLLTERLSAYAGVGYEKNRFAGFSRRFDESVGLGYEAVKTERHELLFEGGLSFFQEALLTGPDNNFTAGRAAGDYRYLFGEKAYFQQLLEYLPNFDNSSDYRLNSESALVAPLNSNVALKVGYLVRYRGEPPVGFDETDTIFRTSVQVTF